MAQVGGVLVPICTFISLADILTFTEPYHTLALFFLAFTTYTKVPWIVPILASVLFGSGIYFVMTATFTYFVTAYRPVAASAMAANSVTRLTSAAVLPLFAPAMYHKLGTVGATALLAALTTVMAPLP